MTVQERGWVEKGVFERTIAALEEFWEKGPHQNWYGSGPPLRHLIGAPDDQPVPDGVQNPYWEVMRRMPWSPDLWRGNTAFPYATGLEVSRHDMVSTYAWSIPSPGDIAWVAGVLDGRSVVEVGAGTGYWAWQLSQAGVDVAAYDPLEPGENHFFQPVEPYVPLLRDDASASAKHPDRALFLSWPSYDDPWAAHALSVYAGDRLIYAGEGGGGCCADDAFFDLLDAEWTEIGDSPHHRSWSGINCYLSAYRRKEEK